MVGMDPSHPQIIETLDQPQLLILGPTCTILLCLSIYLKNGEGVQGFKKNFLSENGPLANDDILPFQGTPIKYESSSGQSAIKHNVKSLITGPSKLPRGMPPLEMVTENVKVVERGKYEDPKPGEVRSRHTSVVSSGPSVLRSTLHEAPKSQVSPGIYEDTNARRTPVNYQSMSRSSPMMNRVTEGVSMMLPHHPQVPGYGKHYLEAGFERILFNPAFLNSVVGLDQIWYTAGRNYY